MPKSGKTELRTQVHVPKLNYEPSRNSELRTQELGLTQHYMEVNYVALVFCISRALYFLRYYKIWSGRPDRIIELSSSREQNTKVLERQQKYIKRPKRTSGRHIHPEGTKSAKNSQKASHDDPLLFGSLLSLY